jgi:TP901 family phage tail tape measure protein
MANFARLAKESAMDLSVSTTEYLDAALIYAQQGLEGRALQDRTEVTIKAARAAGVEMKSMADYLTAMWNTYDLQGLELERSASVLAKLGGDTAASFAEISTAMQIASSAGAQLGVGYEQLSSMIATISANTRNSASTIGTALNTVFARITNLSTGAEDEDGIGLGRISK